MLQALSGAFLGILVTLSAVILCKAAWDYIRDHKSNTTYHKRSPY